MSENAVKVAVRDHFAREARERAVKRVVQMIVTGRPFPPTHEMDRWAFLRQQNRVLLLVRVQRHFWCGVYNGVNRYTF